MGVERTGPRLERPPQARDSERQATAAQQERAGRSDGDGRGIALPERLRDSTLQLVVARSTPLDRFERPVRAQATLADRFERTRIAPTLVVGGDAHALVALHGIPTGISAKLVNFGGAAVGVLELAGLVFPVTPYYLDVTPEIARSSRPETVATYQTWKDRGATAVLNLTAERDFDSAAAEAIGLHTKRVPIIDNTARERIFSTRTTQNAVLDREMKGIIDFVRNEKKTVIHCEAGIGRTGMIVACLQMALYGKTVDEAIGEAVRVASTYNQVKRVVMVPAQIAYIRHFAEELRAGRIEGYPVVPRAPLVSEAAPAKTTTNRTAEAKTTIAKAIAS